MSDQPKGLAKCRVEPALQWREFVRENVTAWIAACEARGLTHWEIATRVGCHRTAISLWKHGKADIYAGSYEALRALAVECGWVERGRKVGT